MDIKWPHLDVKEIDVVLGKPRQRIKGLTDVDKVELVGSIPLPGRDGDYHCVFKTENHFIFTAMGEQGAYWDIRVRRHTGVVLTSAPHRWKGSVVRLRVTKKVTLP